MQARQNLNLGRAEATIIHGVGESVDERTPHVSMGNGEGVWKIHDDSDTSLHCNLELITKTGALSFVPRKGLGKVSCGLHAVDNTHG